MSDRTTPRLDGEQVLAGIAQQEAVQALADEKTQAPCGHCNEMVPLKEGLVLFIYGKVMAVICPRCLHANIGIKCQRDQTTIKVVYTRPTERLIVPAREMPAGLRPTNERGR